MIFFSTTFSPGSGVAGVKELRYLFARFYLWCRLALTLTLTLALALTLTLTLTLPLS